MEASAKNMHIVTNAPFVEDNYLVKDIPVVTNTKKAESYEYTPSMKMAGVNLTPSFSSH